MLSEEVIDKVVERLINRIEEGNTYILKKIGESIKKTSTISTSSAQELYQIIRYGGDYDKIVKKLAEITELNVKDIYKIFDEVAKKENIYFKKFYNYRGKKFIPYEYNTLLKNQVRAIASQTANTYMNLSRTTAFALRTPSGIIYTDLSRTYQNVLDKAILSVSQGKSTFQEGMYSTIKELASSGIRTIDYANGRSMRLDSAVRMNVKAGLRDMRYELQKTYGEEFGYDGWEISVHSAPAPDHAEAQGRQFSIEEYEKLQRIGVAKDYTGKEINMHLDLKSAQASLIKFRPIREYNCYHYEFPIILGVSEPEYSEKELQEIIDENNKKIEFGGKEYTKYECTQLQRKIELEVRKQKDLQIMAKASENDQLVGEAQQKITQLTQKYKELSDVSGLPTKMERMRVSGYQRSKILISEKENTIKTTNTKIIKDKIYDVNWNYINQKEYKEKYNKITNNKSFNEKIYNESIKMLKHRDGTNGEDLIYFDYDKMNLIGTQTNMKISNKTEPTPLMKNALNKNIRIISLHNHSLSNPPSDHDLNSCFEKGYYKGINVCHDGKLIIYSTGKNFKKIDNMLYEMTIAKYKKMGYNEYQAQIKTLKSFQKTNDFRFEVL